MNKRFKRLQALPCCACQAPPPSQVAHANWQEFGKGKGVKADDEYTIPLCHACHQKLDTYQGRTREYAKDWFLSKLDFVNKVLDENKQMVF